MNLPLGKDRTLFFSKQVEQDSIEEISKSKEFYNDLKIDNLKIFIDKKNILPNELSLIGLPTTILFNKEGEEFARILGPIDFEDQKFIEWLKHFD